MVRWYELAYQYRGHGCAPRSGRIPRDAEQPDPRATPMSLGSGAWELQRLSPHATSEARALSSPRSTAKEAIAMRSLSTTREKPVWQ